MTQKDGHSILNKAEERVDYDDDDDDDDMELVMITVGSRSLRDAFNHRLHNPSIDHRTNRQPHVQQKEEIEETQPLEHQKLPPLFGASSVEFASSSSEDLEAFTGSRVTNAHHQAKISRQDSANKPDVGGNSSTITADEEGARSQNQTNCHMNLRRKCHRKQLNMERSPMKRQKSRDMCRPLKQWLYSHRDTPYPSRSEKLELSLVSNLTLTQVSNWFANARRRLKNTVSGPPGMTWSRRMKLYNRHVVGNQELLSISSDGDSSSRHEDEVEEEQEEDEDDDGGKVRRREENRNEKQVADPQAQTRRETGGQFFANLLLHNQSSAVEAGRSTQQNEINQTSAEEFVRKSCPVQSKVGMGSVSAKVKQSIIQRYLNDTMTLGNEASQKSVLSTSNQYHTLQKKHVSNSDHRLILHTFDFRHRNASGSLSSHDYEELSISSRSTPTKDHCFAVDVPADDEHSFNTNGKDFHWKEISAALGLTLLANCVQKVPRDAFFC